MLALGEYVADVLDLDVVVEVAYPPQKVPEEELVAPLFGLRRFLDGGLHSPVYA